MALQKTELHGVWQTAEITPVAPNADARAAQPGLYIFAGNHYSITVVLAEKPRTARVLAADAGIDELREMLRFGAQAGTYEVNGDELILHPSVALRPSAMVPGSEAIYSWSLEGDALSLRPVSNNHGSSIRNREIKLQRVA